MMHDDDDEVPMRQKERHGLDGDAEKTCENCRYFAPEGSGAGECRRHAPAPAAVRHSRGREDNTIGIEGWWPNVSDGDWCGEFEQYDEPINGGWSP